MLRKIHNVETNEIIEIELTADEVKELEKEQAITQAKQAERDEELASKSAQKAALLTRLGLTEDELKTILG